MTGNTFGKIFKITTWGESHGPAMGVVVDGCLPGINLSEVDIQKELDRRRPGQSIVTTTRGEDDKVEILSGIFNGVTTGAPISLVIKNKDSDPSRYDNIKDVFRPGHADFTFTKKYGIRDHRGGGRSSGRETSARVAAGAIAKKLLDMLSNEKIKIYAYAKQIGNVSITEKKLDSNDFEEIEKNIVRCPDKDAAKKMEDLITQMRKEGDSVGGIVEVVIKGVPIGLGDPVFDKLNADLGKALLSIGSVRGIEFGNGFGAATLTGKQNNDEISSKGFLSNNAGGMLGGISNGEDITIRIAVKPTSSISKEQKTITINNEDTKLIVEGRHDPCIVPRIIPVVESMAALVILDKLLIQQFYTKSK